jgi:hypothetical protein
MFLPSFFLLFLLSLFLSFYMQFCLFIVSFISRYFSFPNCLHRTADPCKMRVSSIRSFLLYPGFPAATFGFIYPRLWLICTWNNLRLLFRGHGAVALHWTYFAATAVRRRRMQLRPSSDDDAHDTSVWGAVLTAFPRTFLAVVVVIGWEGRRIDGRQ